MTTRELAEQVRDRWVSRGIAVRMGAAETDLNGFEALHGLRLPHELRDYYSVVNGFDDWEWDDELMEFYSLPRASEATRRFGSDFGDRRGIVLVDHCLLAFLFVALETEDDPETCEIAVLREGNVPHRCIRH